MGGHYGAIHVRTEDHAAVREAVESISLKSERSFYVSPVLHGWVSVYPEKHGHEESISAALATKLPSDIFHLIVHDEAVFYYFFYHDHRLADRFDSWPEYFDDHISASEKKETAGRPDLIKHLLRDPKSFPKLERLLNRKKPKNGGLDGEELLFKFAELFDIANTATAYEFLKDGEQQEIEAWAKFTHIQRPVKAKSQPPSTMKLISSKQDLLLYCDSRPAPDNQLFAPRPHIASDQNGFYLAWEIVMSRRSEPLVRIDHPWTLAQSTGIELPTRVASISTSSKGNFLAAGCTHGEQSHELCSMKERRRLAMGFSASSLDWVGFTPNESAAIFVADGKWISVSTEDGRTLCSGEIPGMRDWHAAMHPSGNLVVENLGKLIVTDLTSGKSRATVYVGGKYTGGSVHAALSRSIASPDFQKRHAKRINTVIRMLSKSLQKMMSPDELKQTLEKKKLEMEADAANLAKNGIQLPDRGAATPFVLSFSANGSQLFVGTNDGCLVYLWERLLQDTESKPTFVAPTSSVGNSVHYKYVFVLEQDARSNLLIFGGYDELSYLNLTNGEFGRFLKLPRPGRFAELKFNSDYSALACVIHPSRITAREPEFPPEVQVWNYPALLKEAGLA